MELRDEFIDILSEIGDERQYQVDKWGDETDDKLNDPMDFVGYIAHHSTRWFNGGFPPYSEATLLNYREAMIKVGALAVAAIGYTDRLLSGENDRPDILESDEVTD
jgi:hypothetical protein